MARVRQPSVPLPPVRAASPPTSSAVTPTGGDIRSALRWCVRLAAVLAVLAAASCEPQGAVEGAFDVSSTPGRIRVVGWALDPDVATPIPVHVYVSGRLAGSGRTGLVRPDLAEGGGESPTIGYDLTVAAATGHHEVCVYAIDDSPGPNALLGCRHVRVGGAVLPVDVRYEASLLTSGAGSDETNAISVSGASTVLSAAPGNTDGNIRFVFVETDGPRLADQQTCATWSDQSGPFNQQGVALRVSTDGPTRAITVTKNVWGDISDVFNVHLWDTSQPGGGLRLLGNPSLASALTVNGQLMPLPWRICARVVGDVLSFKVWPAGRSEPAWGDPTYSRTMQLPADAPKDGRPGWYGGHLYAGSRMTYTDLSAGPA
jgi:hypothetical protein